LEVDYGAIEVRVAACYHRDPNMIRYIREDRDLHKEMAAECFLLRQDQVTKPIRYIGKNGFVFPEFYGSFYPQVAANMWDAAAKVSLEDGTPLLKHLRKKGITARGACDPKKRPRPGTFEYHLQKVERGFWDKRFPVYRDWKDRWWEQYRQRGFYKTKTGFVVSGVFARNEVINGPIQGSAFHCLLWSLIRMQRKLKRYKMKTVVVGQIHDSILLDVPVRELGTVCELVQRIMVDDLTKHWRWIVVPLEVEIEVCDPTWWHKQGMEQWQDSKRSKE